MNSPHGCPVLSTGPLGIIIVSYAWWIGLPLMIIGGYLLGAGGRFPKVTLALFTTLAACLSSLFVLFAGVFPANAPAWSVLIVGIVTFCMGAGLGPTKPDQDVTPRPRRIVVPARVGGW